MEQMTAHIGIEPGNGLVGRFGDTVILIPRGAAGADEAAGELLGVAAAVASDRQQSASMIAARLATWVIGRMPEDVTAFGIVTPVPDGVVVFLRGAVWCAIAEGDSTRELTGEQALTWVDQLVPGTFERLAIGSAAGRPVQPYPMSDLRDGVVPGHGFVLTRRGRPREPALPREPVLHREQALSREPALSREQALSREPVLPRRTDADPAKALPADPEPAVRTPTAAWASPEDDEQTVTVDAAPGRPGPGGPRHAWPPDRLPRPYPPR
jgi:hypothetical protein